MSFLLGYHANETDQPATVNLRYVDRLFSNQDRSVVLEPGEWIAGVETMTKEKYVRTWIASKATEVS